MERFYLIWLAVASGVTFAAYGFDKLQSKTGGWRVPEKALHWMAILGGVAGGWAGRWVFHHKTRKAVFTFVLVIATLIHLGLAYLLFFR